MHKPAAVAPKADSSIHQQPEIAPASSCQPNPLKRKRSSGSDSVWRVQKPLDTIRMESMAPLVVPVESDGDAHDTQPKCAELDEPPAVISRDIATEKDERGSRGEALPRCDPTLSDEPNPTLKVLQATGRRVLPLEPASSEALKQMIESEFSLEILLKHRELRLIDQEIAKCQIALEQLRRCQIIPYPATSSEVGDMQSVASGSGLPSENTVPHPAPWGIAEGPYTRHYARWLVPDSAFDPNFAETLSNPSQAGRIGSERTTRGSASERTHVMSSVRSQRGSSNSRLQALSLGHAEPKEEKGPLILKRAADGRMVKLVCTDCRRDNFNSAQGFINHCRIAHNRGYASHEAAALACGVEVEDYLSLTSAVESPTAAGVKAGLVHPLIRYPTKASTTSRNLSLLSSRQKDSTASPGSLNTSSRSPIRAAKASPISRSRGFSENENHGAATSFIPSPQTPHLSALFAKIGRGGDLNEMVDQAKTRIDSEMDLCDFSDDEDQDEEMEDTSPIPSGPCSLSTRGVVGGAGLSRRPGTRPPALERTPSNKSISGSRTCKPSSSIFPSITYSSPYTVMPAGPPTPPLDPSATLHLTPHTIESHQAPSLISDDDDDGDEYENMHSESDSPSSAEDDGDGGRYVEFEVEDQGDEIDDLGGTESPSLGMAAAVKPHSPGARRSSALRSPTAIRPDPSGRNERHVSFASPGPPTSGENLLRSQKRKGGK